MLVESTLSTPSENIWDYNMRNLIRTREIKLFQVQGISWLFVKATNTILWNMHNQHIQNNAFWLTAEILTRYR